MIESVFLYQNESFAFQCDLCAGAGRYINLLLEEIPCACGFSNWKAYTSRKWIREMIDA